jgi:hypothetical protein
MPLLSWATLFFLVSLAALACGLTSNAAIEPTPPPVQGGADIASPTAISAADPDDERAMPVVIDSHSEEQTREAIEAYLRETEGVIGLDVIQDGKRLLAYNEDTALPLASVIKVAILLAYLDRVRDEERLLTDEEQELLTDMIVVSDNWAAQYFWDVLSTGEHVFAYLDDFGLKPSLGGAAEEWGESRLSAADMGELLSRLQDQRGVPGPDAKVALDLLAAVDEEQRWGATAGLDENETQVFIKNGWYPYGAYEGWRVNSTAIIVPSQGEPYVLVVFTDNQPTFEYGRETVETIATLVNQMMAAKPR